MAYRQARANIARAGVTRANWGTKPVYITVNGSTVAASGTTYKAQAIVSSFSLTFALDGGSSGGTMTWRSTVTPQIYDQIVIAVGAPDHYLFRGTILVRRVTVQRPTTAQLWETQMTDQTWRVNRYARVWLRAYGLPANALLRQIIADFTDPIDGFHAGYVDSAIAETVIDLEFNGDSVLAAILRIARVANGYMRLNPNGDIDLFQSDPSNPQSITDASGVTNTYGTHVRQLIYDEEGRSQVTRVEVEGGGGTVTAATSTGATTIPVSDCRWYSATGGYAMVRQTEIVYTGVDVVSGPGNLTGIAVLRQDVAEGETVRVLARQNDTAAQTALAAALGGGGISGIVVARTADDALTFAEADARALAQLTFNSAAMPGITFVQANPELIVGREVVVTITTPLALSDSFRIQTISIRARADKKFSDFVLDREVTARLLRRQGILDLVGTLES